MIQQRSSGILAHITSLPSPYGIGDLGLSSRKFIDYLVDCDQSYWQFLPTGPTHEPFDYSPYMSSSAFAGSFLLISPDLLYEAGLISIQTKDSHQVFSPYQTEYKEVAAYKKLLLEEAFSNFTNFPPNKLANYSIFLSQNQWLDDYAIFMTAKEIYNKQGWFHWPRELAMRSKVALEVFSQRYESRLNYYRFEQFEFFRQWQLMHSYAQKHHIQLFGDLPIYVSYDSVDVWANQQIFNLDRKTFSPIQVAGVPPDYFSETGQRWGNPLYTWHSKDKQVQEDLINWWAKRLANLFKLVDIARIDHFRGFESYWAIDEKCETAIDGTWLKGPGKAFFDQISKQLGPLNIVAEDLGIITAEVEVLRDELGFPGMKVLQFAFDGNPDNSFLPHNFTSPNFIVYSGTHDNNTAIGWFLSDKLSDSQRAEVRQIANRESDEQRDIHHDLIYMAHASIAALSIFPLQDVLGFGGDCKMNSPGIATGNWRWRCSREFLTSETAKRLRISTQRYNRGNRQRKSSQKNPNSDL